jgi:hypothetical protein
MDTHILQAFVDELVRNDVCAAVTSPDLATHRSSSRSCAMAVCPATGDRRAQCRVLRLGWPTTGRPAVVACTSGSAAANYAPAVNEADQAGVPLIVLTADRPPELRDVGAGQTIDQIKLYGSAVRWFVEFGTHEHSPERSAGADAGVLGHSGGDTPARATGRCRTPRCGRWCRSERCPSRSVAGGRRAVAVAAPAGRTGRVSAPAARGVVRPRRARLEPGR